MVEHLNCRMCSAQNLFRQERLAELQGILTRVAPEWSQEISVVEDEEEMENGYRIEMSDPASLFAILTKEAAKTDPYRQRAHENRAKLARADGKQIPPYDPEELSDSRVITDVKQDLMLFLKYDNKPNLLEQNCLGGHCYSRKFEGIRSEVFLQSLFVELATRMPFDYGHAELGTEWADKHAVTDGHYIGIDFQRYLPGLSWLNFFGPLYCDFIGRKRLLTAPGKWVKELAGGVLIALGDSPYEWDSLEYRERCAAVEAYLGQEYFFNITDPNRNTRAPGFL